MEEVLKELIELLLLEKIEEGVYRGRSQDLGYPRVFGGQVLGQALTAAAKTVTGRCPHSLHAYFLRPGDPHEPIRYEVDLLRDGKSFTTRRVVAWQQGKAIFNMSASFQLSETGFEHQRACPVVPGPEGLPSELDRARQMADKIPEKLRYKFTCERPIEIRPVKPVNYFAPQQEDACHFLWMRTISPLPPDPLIHQCLLAYASDFGLLGASLRPHKVSFLQKEMQVASLDHGMWFHRPFLWDDWLLYEVESPSAAQARGFNLGRFYDLKGRLIASTVQEGLIRFHGEE